MSDSNVLRESTAPPTQSPVALSPDWIVPKQPLKIPEILALFATVALWDIAVYGGFGYAAFAVFLVLAPILWAVGSPVRGAMRFGWFLWALLAILALRMVWCGAGFGALMGLCLVAAFAMSLTNYRPFPPEGLLFVGQALLGGLIGQFGRIRSKRSPSLRVDTGWRSILIPACFVAGFLLIFIFANPVIREVIDRFIEWLMRFPISMERMLFWLVTLWCVGGLVRPIVLKKFRNFMEKPERDEWSASLSMPFDLFSVARNTLIAVVALFVPYLCFEFYYFWVREIPEGFYYSGYAHQGAFWLTVALALSTFTLGFIFRGPLLEHPKLDLLKKLTWIWCVQNFALAVCVFHRVWIYIEYNGLSRMRVVALYGIAAVFIGFLLVVWKVLKGMNLLWLVRRDLWALFLVCFVHTLTPVDFITTRYNVSEILSGNHAPSVLLSVHPIGPEGVPELLPLIESESPIIREGAWAMLANAKVSLEAEARGDETLGWKARQLAREWAIETLNSKLSRWNLFEGHLEVGAAKRRFDDYARQWYD